jgi:hypothetical protein
MAATLAARVLSIVGHPGLLMPVAVAIGTSAADLPSARVQAAVAAALSVAAIIGAFSLWQVRRGRWAHVDASLPHERRQLNPFAALLLFAAALALAGWGRSPHGAIGAALAGVLVLAAQLLRRRMKLSLHCAFAAYAAAIVWPGVAASLSLALLALGVAWSRLQLRRHTRGEVVVGLGLGTLAGLMLQLLSGWIGSA